MLTAQEGSASIAEILIAAGAQLDPQGQDGNTALMVAARDGNMAVVKMLLAAGADPLIRNVVSIHCASLLTVTLY